MINTETVIDVKHWSDKTFSFRTTRTFPNKFENGEFAGLDWISGEVKKINNQNNNLKIPHMGWNTLKFLKETAFTKCLLKKMKVTNMR